MTRRLLLLVALATVAVACGHKTRPLAPELVRPETPGEVIAASIPEGIRLTWKRPDRYTGGKHMNDLAGFVVERAATEAGPFASVGEVELDDRGRFRQERRITWTDTTVTAGELYAYRITALTLDGYRSAPSAPVSLRYERKTGK